jgi:hypothetical protein
MIEQTNANAEIRKALSHKGITSGAKLARFLNAEGVIFFLRGPDWRDSHAELRLRETGQVLEFYPQPGDERLREACVDRAVDAACEITGIDEWSKAPYSNCWLPSKYVERLHEDFLPEDFPQSA